MLKKELLSVVMEGEKVGLLLEFQSFASSSFVSKEKTIAISFIPKTERVEFSDLQGTH